MFTVEEVASILKLNQQTIRNWIDLGILPAVRIGRCVRIKRPVLQDILENGLSVEGEEGLEEPEMPPEIGSTGQEGADAL